MAEISTSSITGTTSSITGSTTLIDPSTGQAFDTVHQTTREQVDDAIARAVVAQRAWAALAPAARAQALRDFATVVGTHVEELAALEVVNSGHPISQARWEAGHVRDVLNYYAAAPERMKSEARREVARWPTPK